MAAIFGGALLVSWLTAGARPDHVLAIAVRYEQIFWAGIGVLVMTGVGNLGAFGLALPIPSTSWGETFVAKLWFVGVLVLLSLPRSLVVARGRADARDVRMLRRLYVITTVVIAAIAGLAVWLAHG
jgi:hypothetical protein